MYMLQLGYSKMGIQFKIIVFGSLLLVAGSAMEVAVIPLEIGTSGTIPCDYVVNDNEVRLVQWFKSRRIDVFVNGDPSLARWAQGETGSLPKYHIENTTFSLVIDKASMEDEGLYECHVLRGDLIKSSNYYTRTVMYALPRIKPEITLDPAFNRVNCTVEHVKPLVYPVLNFDLIPDSTETYAVLHEDGTYTTWVSCTLPHTKSASRVDCSFSYLNYQTGISLDLRDTTTDSLIDNKATTVSPTGKSVTCACHKCTLAEIAVGVLFLTNLIMFIIWTFHFFQVDPRKILSTCRLEQGRKEDKESKSVDFRLP